MGRRYRRYGRVQLPDKHMLQCEGIGRALEGKVTVLGLGGMFLRTGSQVPAGESLRVRINGEGTQVEAECVVRTAEKGGVGVEFVQMQESQTANLQRLLRNLKIQEAG